MIVHIVLFSFKDSVQGMGRKQIAHQVKESFEALAPKLTGVRKFEVGLNFNQAPVAFDLVLNSEFESFAALEAYQVHPGHQQVKSFIDPFRDRVALVDYEV